MILVFDTETTGFPLRRYAPPASFHNWDTSRLIEIAWFIFDPETHEKVDSRQFLIKPNSFYIPNADFHGITQEIAMRDGVPLADVFDALKSVLPSVTLVVAHNVDFDDNVLQAEMFRANELFLQRDWSLIPKFCTMKTTTNSKWPRLIELYTRLFPGEEPLTQHRAASDAEMCARCYFQVINK